MYNKFNVACFSGHRHIQDNPNELKNQLKSEVLNLIEQGVIFFGAGGALGFDMLAEETVLELKKIYTQIKLILVLPCPPEQQTLKWNDDQKQRYFNILKQADKVRVLSPIYTDSCMFERNRHLINNSAHLICYLRKKQGGTAFTVKYAENQRLNIIKL